MSTTLLASVLTTVLAASAADPPAPEGAATESPPSGKADTCGASDGGASAYVVGTGDVVKVRVYGEDDLSGAFPVDAGGHVNLPLVGRVGVGGLTVGCVAARIHDALEDGYLRDPDVTVTLDGYKSQAVSLLGSVRKPGVYYLEGPTTLLEMLSKAGGLTTDGIDALRVTRAGAVEEVVDIPYDALVTNGKGNLVLRAGDIIYVPELTISVMGSVGDPGDVPYSEGLSVSRCIAAAGGATELANLGRVYVLRNNQRIRVNVRRVLAGKDPDMVLQPGDQVFVKESNF